MLWNDHELILKWKNWKSSVPTKERRGGKHRRRSPPPPSPPSPVHQSKTQRVPQQHQQHQQHQERTLWRYERSEWEANECQDQDDDIALNLRPILPKKPLQLPRFSPSAAWKALGGASVSASGSGSAARLEASGYAAASAGGCYPTASTDCSSIATDSKRSGRLLASSSRESDMSEDEDVFEERIARNSRPVAPLQPRISNEKSADSGISGDAGSPDAMMHPISDKPLAMSSPVPHHVHAGSNWTPEQDLGESSNEADVNDQALSVARRKSRTPEHTAKILPKSLMFNEGATNGSIEAQSRSSSVSKSGRKFRKKNEIDSSAESSGGGGGGGSVPHKYNSLRKLKRSVSGAIAMMAIRSRSKSPDARSASGSDNWVLSRSAPNSIVNGFGSGRSLHRSDTDLGVGRYGMIPLDRQYPSYSQPAMITQRIVYLPQYDARKRSVPMTQVQGIHQQQQIKQRQEHEMMMMRRAKSADALYLESRNAGRVTAELPSSGSMFDVAHFQTSTPKMEAPAHRAARRMLGKRFTFQSTVYSH